MLPGRVEVLALVLAPVADLEAEGEAPAEDATVAVVAVVVAGADGAGISEEEEGGGLSWGAGEGAIATAALIVGDGGLATTRVISRATNALLSQRSRDRLLLFRECRIDEAGPVVVLARAGPLGSTRLGRPV